MTILRGILKIQYDKQGGLPFNAYSHVCHFALLEISPHNTSWGLWNTSNVHFLNGVVIYKTFGIEDDVNGDKILLIESHNLEQQ